MKVLLCAIAKLENNYLREWVEHYKNIGFDNICLFDNNDIDGEHFDDVIDDYIKNGFVKVENARGFFQYQIESYNVCYEKYRTEYDWIAFFDLDEFLWLDPKFNNDVKLFLSKQCFKSYNNIRICWENYNDSNLYEVRKDNYSIKRFTKKTNGDNQTKGIIRTNFKHIYNNSAHLCSNKISFKTCNAIGQQCNCAIIINKPTLQDAKLKHYRCKTVEEFYLSKYKRGWPTWFQNGKVPLSLFYSHNKKTAERLLIGNKITFANNNKQTECTGCGACYNICPQHAIKMVELKNGFLYPNIDTNKCLNCGLCRSVCQLYNKNSYKTKYNVYGGFIKDDNIRKKSSSGGIFYAISEKILSSGNGIVFAVRFDSKFKAIYDSFTDLSQIYPFMGSKYMQAEIGNAFLNVKKSLLEGKTVGFVGTPCQINGLNLFLGKQYDNLYMIEILCHGVTSYNTFRDKISNDINVNSLTYVNFRDKTNGWQNYNLTLKDDTKTYSQLASQTPFMKTFLNDSYLRPSCYKCMSKVTKTGAVLSIGDFWGVSAISKIKNDNKGISFIQTYNLKGDNFLHSLNNLFIVEIPNDISAVKYNGGLGYQIKKRSLLPKVTFNSLPQKNNIKNIINMEYFGIISLKLHSNFGGILQTYALQQILQKLGIKSSLIEVNNKAKQLSFTTKYINIDSYQSFNEIKQNTYNGYIVGSDQVWRGAYQSYKENAFLTFTEKWNDIKRIAYAASFGVSKTDLSSNIIKSGIKMLPKFDAVSVREDSGINILKNTFNFDKGIHVLDPTMLLTPDDYKKFIINEKDYSGSVISYFLDTQQNKTTLHTTIAQTLNKKKVKISKTDSVESFLAKFATCDCVITDSFHGCIFSIIFNKPFIVFQSTSRGSARMDSLLKIFNLTDRFVTSNNRNTISSKLSEDLNITSILQKEKDKSMAFLIDALQQNNCNITHNTKQSDDEIVTTNEVKNIIQPIKIVQPQRKISNSTDLKEVKLLNKPSQIQHKTIKKRRIIKKKGNQITDFQTFWNR